MTDQYCIRQARKGDMKAIKEIELSASTRFKGTGLVDHLLDHHFEQALLKDLISDGQVWVAETLPQDAAQPPAQQAAVGFAIASILGNLAYLEELDVLVNHGRKGLGRRLVESVASWARAKDFKHLTLSTFINVAWNAPFYETLGFEKLPKSKWEKELEEIYILELKLGLPVEERTFMRLKL